MLVRVTYVLNHTFPMPHTDVVEVEENVDEKLIERLNEIWRDKESHHDIKPPTVRKILLAIEQS